MLRRRSGFSAAVLLAGALLTTAPAALAKPIHPAPPAQSTLHEALGTVWRALTGLFGSSVKASTACGERGSIMDPNGCPGTQASSDSGSIMDPNG